MKESMIPSRIPSKPWEMVATDLFTWDKSECLLVVDYHSRYVEVAKLPDTKSTTVVTCTKSIFARHGTVGGAMASWLVRLTPERAVQVRALVGDIVPLSTQVYKWVPANWLGNLTNSANDLRWTSIPSRGSRNTSSRLMLQKPKVSKASHHRHGIPFAVISDKDSQNSSKDFSLLAKQWEFKHTTVGPLYPQANGLVEKEVQTVKNLLTKAKQDRMDP